ncbi:hypothetical protein [Zestomonas thermotolerans]|uniref:hypothetical protein n=1 Tax=Zestomonas thermotolerans TaxID=157784 RepID=UPI0003A75953|nr:hypothetical protein [Pseudomonas thermotolerans]
MRRTLSLLFAGLLAAPGLMAEEAAVPASPDPRLVALEQRLAESERLRGELDSRLQSLRKDGDAQLTRLLQENRRLKLQLNEALAERQPRWLDERQQWFAAGGGVALLGVLLGALLRGRRRTRREWLN